MHLKVGIFSDWSPTTFGRCRCHATILSIHCSEDFHDRDIALCPHNQVIGAPAKMQFPVSHTWCGYALANAGHDSRALQAWLDHIQHTVRYTELAPDRFKNFWR
jgi:hypothetical protein